MISSVDTILKNAYIITVDDKRRIITAGAIAIKEGKIVSVGKTRELLSLYKANSLIDCAGGVVHPGLIDAHEHLAWHITRSWEPDTFTVKDTWKLFEDPLIANISSEDERLGAMLATMEMAVNGTTMFGDTGGSFFLDATLEGANATGIKGFTGAALGDNFVPELWRLQSSTKECLDILEKQINEYPQGKERLVGSSVGIVGMNDCTDELVVGAKEIARKYNLQMQVHLAVYQEEVKEFIKKHGETPVKHYYNLGVLDEGTTLVHMIHLQEDELKLMEKTRPSVVHCPGASLRYGLGAASKGYFPEMHERGINIALGTDAGNWCDSLDIFRQIYLTAVIHREVRRSGPVFTCEEAFEMATISGAKALGMSDSVGSIEVGKAADIVIHNPVCEENLPMFDQFNSLIYSSQSKSVDSVMVNGEFIVKDGKTTRVSLNKVAPIINSKALELAGKMKYSPCRQWPII